MSAAVVLLMLATVPAQDHSMHHPPAATPPQASAAAEVKQGTDLPPGDAPAPPAPMPHYADRYWDAAEMARARTVMMRDDGGGRRFAQVMVDIAEVAVRDGRDGYRWDGEAWVGGDIHRLALKSEGEGGFAGRVEDAEVQALYSRAIDPYFNLQLGVRQDLGAVSNRTYAVVGVEGLAPYWFEIDAAAFVSTKGEVTARVGGYYDQRITQRLIVQPRAELNLSAQRFGILDSGLTSVELEARVRYEVSRRFAPYVGLTWDRRLGGTARLARQMAEPTSSTALVLGLRTWF